MKNWLPALSGCMDLAMDNTPKVCRISFFSNPLPDGLALVPLSVYFKNARVKVEVGLCKGKKNYDKRDAMAKRDAKRDIDRAMKSYNR